MRQGWRLITLGLCGCVAAAAATLGNVAQSVLPQNTRQVISINYHRLASDPVAQALEKQVLPPTMNGFTDLLVKAGLNPAQDVNRLTFATYQADKSVGLIGIIEGNLGNFQTARFFTKTPKQPTPPEIDGVPVYSSAGLSFYLPDPSTLVFGSHDAVAQAIATQQGAAAIAQNEAMTNLIAGTQSSDVWSVIDAPGTRAMIGGMLAGATGPIDPKLIENRFDGARYTIGFDTEVQVNLELMTTDTLSAAAVATGLNAAIAMRQKQETNPTAKSLLGQISVDSAGDHAFLQMSTPESEIQSLLHTDLLQTILH